MRWPPADHDWPNSDVSRQVRHRRHEWHVQEAGTGPVLLLIHGAGGATQSWRGLFSALSETHRVVSIDLPGQGYTRLGARWRCGLDPMAEDLAALCDHIDARPDIIIGHSAGAAIGLRMALARPVPVIGLNAALGHFKGIAGWLFPAMAKMLALNPFTAPMVTATMTDSAVERLLVGTGSTPDAEMRRLYGLLARDRRHVDATLSMMAQWRLDPLLDRLDQIASPVTLLVGSRDLAVPPDVSRDVMGKLPNGRLVEIEGLGHLMHEEAPEVILSHLAAHGVASPIGAA